MQALLKSGLDLTLSFCALILVMSSSSSSFIMHITTLERFHSGNWGHLTLHNFFWQPSIMELDWFYRGNARICQAICLLRKLTRCECNKAAKRMDIEELKSLSYYFSGCIKFQQSSLENACRIWNYFGLGYSEENNVKHIFHTVHDVFWSWRYATEWVLFNFKCWYTSCEGMQAPLCFHCCCSICVCMSSLL